jgi:hypothetical protein
LMACISSDEPSTEYNIAKTYTSLMIWSKSEPRCFNQRTACKHRDRLFTQQTHPGMQEVSDWTPFIEFSPNLDTQCKELFPLWNYEWHSWYGWKHLSIVRILQET